MASESVKQAALPRQPVGSAISFRRTNVLASSHFSCWECRSAARLVSSSADLWPRPTAGALQWSWPLLPALLLIPALLLLPEPQRGASEIHPVPLSRGSMWTILRIPTLWWIIGSGALLNFNMYAIATFLPAFLSRLHGVSVASSGVASGIVYLSGGLTAAASPDTSVTASRVGGKMAACESLP